MSSGWPISRMHPLLGVLAGRLHYIFRLAYKPHFVRRLISVYAIVLRRSSGYMLHPGMRACAIISLSSLPGTNNEASRFSSLLGLAPGGGYLAARIAADAGGLLHHLFTVTSAQGKGGLFLWP